MAGATKSGEQRRGKLARIWQKLRDAVKRRQTAPVEPSDEPMAKPQPPSAAATTTAEPPSADRRPSRTSFAVVTPSSIIVDETIATDDSFDLPVPMLSTGTSLSKERAQQLFDRYGITFEPHTTGKEPEVAHGVRRVHKSIRVRVRYSCEECGTAYGSSKICLQCGHRRCRDCPRNPPRRVREVLDEAREQQRERRKERAEQAAGEQQRLADDSMVAGIAGPSSGGLQLDSTVPPRAELEGALTADTMDAPQYQYVVQTRPHVGVQLLLRPRAQLVRRICHECEDHFEPANPSKCPTCNHRACKLCQHETPESTTQDTSTNGQQRPSQPIMATVQRVYKKPRQRVRWTCDQCDALFIDRDRCQECGHIKCEDCIRSP